LLKQWGMTIGLKEPSIPDYSSSAYSAIFFMNKVAELYDKFVVKYGQDTMRVPTMELSPGQSAPVEEIPSSPKVPSFDSKPSYNDVYVDSPRKIAPDKAISILIARCEETELFTPQELKHFSSMAKTKGPQVTFKEVSHQIQRKLFAAETCLQILRNISQHFG
jgi:hypothetical protein